MRPDVKTKPLSALTKANQVKACSCKERCEYAYIVTSDNGAIAYLCDKSVIDFATDLFTAAGITAYSRAKHATRGWTTQQEAVLIEWITTKGISYGDYRILGDLLGKSRDMVRLKVQDMRRENKLSKDLKYKRRQNNK